MDFMTYEQSRDDMLQSPYNKLFSEVEHNLPLTIRTACVVSYAKGSKNFIIGATLIQDTANGKSVRITLPPGYKLPWSD
jgi:hypothetical protein